LLDGNYKTGYATAGTYNVKFSKTGYFPKTISGILLTNGIVTALNVQLVRDFSSIEEQENKNLVTVYPNPFSESAEVIIDESLIRKNSAITFELKDQQGRMVRKIENIKTSRF
jgi:hypothetical protein